MYNYEKTYTDCIIIVSWTPSAQEEGEKMSVELITKNHGDEIRQIFSSVTDEIQIISPFMGKKTCEELAAVINLRKISCRIITRFYREDFIQNVSSLEGLELLINAGAQIFALIGLHTKLYTIDKNFSIITSANYTLGGMYNNYELGIKIVGEAEINAACSSYFNELWKQIETFNALNNNKALVSLELIEKEKTIVNQGSSSRTKSTVNINRVMQGAELQTIVSTDLFEKALTEKYKSEIDSELGGWLKFEADAQHRHNPNVSYIDSTNNYTRNKTFFTTRPVGVKSSDRLFLALVSYDNDNVATPVIIGRAFSSGFNSEYIVKENFKGWESWMLDYPFYVELNDIELIKGPAKNGISLLDIYRKIKGNIYPSTFGTDIPFEKIRQYHYQKDKIRITKFAEEYINQLLESKFSEFGKEDIWNFKENS
jgi:hypothetical protein